MITIVEGRPGQGKTLFGVDRIFQGLSNPKTLVASNIDVAFEQDDRRQMRFVKLSLESTVQDILSLDLKNIYQERGFTRILLVVDEVQIIMNSRAWEDMPPSFQFFLQQHRHYKFDIIGLTQSVKRADVVMRELVQYWFRLYKVMTFTVPKIGSFGLFVRVEYDPDSIESPSRSYDRVGFGLPIPIFVTPPTFRAYDTYQKFPLLERKGRIELRKYIYEEKMVTSPKLLSKELI